MERRPLLTSQQPVPPVREWIMVRRLTMALIALFTLSMAGSVNRTGFVGERLV